MTPKFHANETKHCVKTTTEAKKKTTKTWKNSSCTYHIRRPSYRWIPLQFILRCNVNVIRELVLLQSPEKPRHKRPRLLSSLSFQLRHTRLKQTDTVSKSKWPVSTRKQTERMCIREAAQSDSETWVMHSIHYGEFISIKTYTKIFLYFCPLTIQVQATNTAKKVHAMTYSNIVL